MVTSLITTFGEKGGECSVGSLYVCPHLVDLRFLLLLVFVPDESTINQLLSTATQEDVSITSPSFDTGEVGTYYICTII